MKKKYLIIGVLSVLIMMIGASYAYFTSAVVGEGKRMSVSANRLAVIFTDTKEITETEITPGWNTSKTFTVENKSGSVFYYDINIDNLVNTFVTTGYLQYKVTSTDGGYNMSDFIDIPKSEEARREKLASNIQIENGSTHTYTIEFKYPNDPNVNQSDDMGKELSGSLSITESNIVVVKYKVNNVIQDTIPEKTEPYIVDKVECSNNAKGTWNEITEKVDLTGEVTQTVCIVEFKEENTITMSTEHGEVVSPVRKVVGRIGSTTFTIEEKAGYSLDDAAIVCDNGAEGDINNKTITITNIKQNNTCKVITNPISMTVTYDVNGGNAISPSSKEVIYTSTYGSLPTPTRTGYTFSGWYTAVSGGTQIKEDTEVTSTSSHTIYARWTANQIAVTYNVNGGNALNPGSKNVTYAGTYGSLPTPTRTGHTFAGWWTAASGGSQVTSSTQVTNANNHSIYARWTVNTYTVTYDVNGGNGLNPGSKGVTYGSTYGNLPTPTRTGHTFAGWWTAASGGSQVTSSTQVTNANNHRIYAHWTINSYNVSVTVNNGYTTSTNPLPINHGGSGSITIAANPGYKLDGATVTCDTGGSYNQAGTVSFSGVTSGRSCTIILAQGIYTITMNSLACPTNTDYITEACHIISRGIGTKHHAIDWGGAAIWEGKTYTGCKIINYSQKYGSTSGGCVDKGDFDVKDLGIDGELNQYFNKTGSVSTWRYRYYASCSVTLECTGQS